MDPSILLHRAISSYLKCMALFLRHIMALRNLNATAHLILPEVYGTVPPAYHGTEEP
jgi:hypothetical protein